MAKYDIVCRVRARVRIFHTLHLHLHPRWKLRIIITHEYCKIFYFLIFYLHM
jgi:hypothetical protein